MITVIFDGRNRRSIGEARTVKEAMDIVADFLREAEKKTGFRPSYTRMAWKEEDCMLWLDVGSYTEFFELVFDTPEEFREARKEGIS